MNPSETYVIEFPIYPSRDPRGKTHLLDELPEFPQLTIQYISGRNRLGDAPVVCFWEGDLELTLDINGQIIIDHDQKSNKQEVVKVGNSNYIFQGQPKYPNPGPVVFLPVKITRTPIITARQPTGRIFLSSPAKSQSRLVYGKEGLEERYLEGGVVTHTPIIAARTTPSILPVKLEDPSSAYKYPSSGLEEEMSKLLFKKKEYIQPSYQQYKTDTEPFPELTQAIAKGIRETSHSEPEDIPQEPKISLPSMEERMLKLLIKKKGFIERTSPPRYKTDTEPFPELTQIKAKGVRDTSHDVSEKDILHVRLNQPFIIEWSSNPSTGYKWFLDPLKDLRIIHQGYWSDCFSGQKGLAGCGGYEYFILAAIKRGILTFSGKYVRGWETPSADDTRKVVQIIIE